MKRKLLSSYRDIVGIWIQDSNFGKSWMLLGSFWKACNKKEKRKRKKATFIPLGEKNFFSPKNSISRNLKNGCNDSVKISRSRKLFSLN